MAKKRGVVPTTILRIFFLLIGFFMFLVIYDALDSSLQQQTDYATQNNLQQLALNVKQLVSADVSVAIATMPLYVAPDYILVGFGKEQEVATENCRFEDPIKKPNVPACKESCICAYENGLGNDFGDDTNLKFCAALPVDNVMSIDYRGYNYNERSFTAKYISENDKNLWKIFGAFAGYAFSKSEYYKPALPEQHFTQIKPAYDYTYFVLYGECGSFPPEHTINYGSSSGKGRVPDKFGLQYITLEVIKANNKRYLTIFYKNTVGYDQRKKELDKINAQQTAPVS